MVPPTARDEWPSDDMMVRLSVQTTDEPGRRLVILAADGRRVVAAGEDLAGMVEKLGKRWLN